MYLYQRVSYTQLILRGAELTKYKSYLTECNESANDLVGDKRTLGDVKAISTEPLWTWAYSDGIAYEGCAYLGFYKCVEFEKDLWLEFVKCMWRNHRSFFQYHLNSICKDIVKPFRVGILCYTDNVQDMYNLAKHLHPPSIKGGIFEAESFKVRYKESSVQDIRVAIKDGLHLSMQDELGDNNEYYS